MNSQIYRTAGYVAILCGIAAILTLVTSVLFFSLEAPTVGTDAARTHLWGPLSDLTPIIQMALLLGVAYFLFQIQRSAAATLSWIATVVGVIGMLGVIAFQALLMLQVIPFEQEVGPMLMAMGLVGVWVILVNYLGRQQTNLPAWLTWLGVAVGVAFILEPVLLAAMGGAVNWKAMVSSPAMATSSALVFLVAYLGFPIWSIGLGWVLIASHPDIQENPVRANTIRNNKDTKRASAR